MNLIQTEKDGKHGFTDEHGKEIIPVIHDFIRTDELYAYVRKDKKWGYLDKEGKEAVPCIYDYVHHSLPEGLALINKDGKYGYVNEQAVEVIPAIYDKAYGFHHNWAKVKKNGKWGYISHSGEELIPCIYDDMLYDFTEELLGVEINGKWGYMDKNGKEIIPLQYERADTFNRGLASVSIGGIIKNNKLVGGNYGCINKTGEEIIPVKYKGNDAYKIHHFYNVNECFELSRIAALFQNPLKSKQTLGKQLFETVHHLLQSNKLEYLGIETDKILPIAIEWAKSSKTSERKMAAVLIQAVCMYSRQHQAPKIAIDADTQKAFRKVMSKESMSPDDYFEEVQQI